MTIWRWSLMSGYRSYGWWRPPLNEGPRGYSEDEERLDLAVRNNVESALSARGFYPSGTRAADFVVRYGVALYEEPTQSFAEYLTYYAGGKDMGAITHHWNERWRSTATFGYVHVDNTSLQEPTAYRNTRYGSVNVIYQFYKRLSVGLEGLYGFREVRNGDDTKDVVRVNMETTIGIVTALNPILGYEKATELAAEAQKSGKGILEVIREKKALTEPQIKELLDPLKLTNLDPAQYRRKK